MGELERRLPQARNRDIGFGSSANLTTVAIMRKLARTRAGLPLIREVALKILERYRTKSHNYFDEARAIGEWVRDNVHYVKDPAGLEQITDPERLLRLALQGRAHGDCDDQALLAATLLRSIGHTPKFKIVRYYAKTGPYNHIYVVDYAGNKEGERSRKRLVIDPIMKDKPIGYEVPHMDGREIPV